MAFTNAVYVNGKYIKIKSCTQAPLKHTKLIKDAIYYLLSLGHKEIKVEHRIMFNGKYNNEYGAKSIIIDVVALDGNKVAIECGNISQTRPNNWKELLKELGFKVMIFPYGTKISEITKT